MLTSPTVDLVALLGFAGIAAAAAVSDLRSRTVPNRYCLGMALLYPVHVLAAPAPVDWLGGLAVGAACLAAGFVLFSMRWFGGGDAKLFAAASLWAGPSLLPALLLGTGIAGAVLAIVYLVQRRLSGTLAAAHPAGPATGEPAPSPAGRWQRTLPYGVAIAAGCVQLAVMLFLGR